MVPASREESWQVLHGTWTHINAVTIETIRGNGGNCKDLFCTGMDEAPALETAVSGCYSSKPGPYLQKRGIFTLCYYTLKEKKPEKQEDVEI